MEFFTDKQIEETYKTVEENITGEQIKLLSDIMESIIKNISYIITYYLEIHNKMFKVSKVYREFVECVFDKKNYNKLLSAGALRQGLNTANSLRSLGLFSLTRKIFRADNKSVEKKTIEYFSHIEPVMEMYVEAHESNLYFPFYFYTIEILKGIAIESLNEVLKNYKF